MTFALSPGESVNVEPGAMVAMGGVEMQTRKSGGGVFTSLKKMALGGESFSSTPSLQALLVAGLALLQVPPATSKASTSFQAKSSTSKVAPTLPPLSTSSPTPSSKVQRAFSAANQCSSFKPQASRALAVCGTTLVLSSKFQSNLDKPSLLTPATLLHSTAASNTPSTRLAA